MENGQEPSAPCKPARWSAPPCSMHATMLFLLGLDDEKLMYRYSRRDFRLTDLAGVVAKGVIA